MDDPVKNPYIAPSDVGNESTVGHGNSIRAQVRVGQIITFALLQGIVVVTAIMVYMAISRKPANPPPLDDPKTQLFIAIGVLAAVGAVIGALVVNVGFRGRMTGGFRQHAVPGDLAQPPSIDAAAPAAVLRLLMRAQTATLIGQSMMEGAAFLNAILLMLDGSLLHIPVIAVMLIGIALLTPTVGKRTALIEEAMRS